MPSRRELLAGIASAASVVLPLRTALIGTVPAVFTQAAWAQGKGGGNGGNGNGNSGKGSGASGSAEGRGGGRGETSRNGSPAASNRSRRGNVPDPQRDNRAGTSKSRSMIEVHHGNGMKERITNGRYVMTDAQGRTIINRIATKADLARLKGIAATH